MSARTWILVAALAGAVIGASTWFGQSVPEAAPLQVATATTTESAAITVHVSGEVTTPGLVVIPFGSRLADAVAAAGGTRRTAALDLVNLAAPLVDGQQVVIPRIGDGGAGGAATSYDGLIHINTATISELEQLPGVGPVLAERIASFRDENGPFTMVEDLLDVSGIGEAKLEALRDAVAVP